eukprot:TRINITY_DN15058_c0_g1_i1.p1 TRINITY_DN15058_c0_g1~~TRINITY_DN15058_c0_g1_i1.p1  ORF type:complete len:597 (-),score=135.89 TRINITY_DN15058_c0_g1_i1:185-1975(-)
MFSSKSGSRVSIGPVRYTNHAPCSISEHEDVEKAKALESFEESMKSSVKELFKITKSLAKLLEKGQVFTKQHSMWEETLIKAKVEGDARSDTGLGQAIVEITKLENRIVELENKLIAETQARTLEPLNTLISQTLEQRKTPQKKYEKALAEYESLVSKSKAAQSSKKLDVMKLYILEKEKFKARDVMENARLEYSIFMEDIQSKLLSDVLEYLIAGSDIMLAQLGQGYAEASAVKEYFDKLQEWAGQENSSLQTMIDQRESEWAQQLAYEEATRSHPLRELICTPPFTVMRFLREAEKADVAPAHPNYHMTTIPAFARVLDGSSKSISAFGALISNEINSLMRGGVLLFGANVTAQETFQELCKLYNSTYAKNIIESTIKAVLATPNSFAVNNPEGAAKVVERLNAILSDSAATLGSLPQFHKELLAVIKKVCPNQTTTVYNMLIIGRAIATPLQDPGKYGITRDPVPDTAKAALHFMGQFLQIFAKNETFPPVHPHAGPLNSLLTEWRDKYVEIWKKVQSQFEPSPEFPYLSSDCDAEMDELREKLVDYYRPICASLAEDKEMILNLTSALTLLEIDTTTTTTTTATGTATTTTP